MSATHERDHAIKLAKTDPGKALLKARMVSEPWFRAQALSWVARFTDGDPITTAAEAAIAASEGDDEYKRSAVRSWEIAALAERHCSTEARKSLSEAVQLARTIHPISSRSEALLLLIQAAFSIDRAQAAIVKEVLESSCPANEHWRCKRARREAQKMIDGEMKPRMFFL
jgi:hypothetical protein